MPIYPSDAMHPSKTGMFTDHGNDAEPWSLGDDEFLVAYWGVGLDMIGPHDLGRSPSACKTRLEFLRSSKAIRAINDMSRAEHSGWHAPGKTMAYRKAWKERFEKALARYRERVSEEPA